MNLSGGMANLISRAIMHEAKGNSIAEKFMKLDPTGKGYISVLDAIAAICDILRVPAPTGDDFESVKACHEILEDVEMALVPDPAEPKQKVVKYGKFLKGFRSALEKSPLVAVNPYVKSEADHMMDHKKRVQKSDLTIKEILKVMDHNLPKYYKSTTEAFLRMKPPGGIFRIADFARFMRSINLDLPDEKLRELFNTYDKDGSGGLEAWEFIESFGPAINGHADTSTSLFLGGVPSKKSSRALKEVSLSVEQVRSIILARLPLHYRSSTKAFLAAKGGVNPRSHTIAFKDLKVWLQNLNIIVPDETIHGLFKYLDEDGSGDVTAREFIKAFGCAISGEKSENIGDAEHLSFHNTRPDKRVTVVPPKHKWTYEEVRAALSSRLGLIHTSSTKAFMKAKRSTSQTMSLADLKRMLNNLNIDPDDKVIRRMHKEIDDDGDGRIQCSEFVRMFGSDINGHAGSFESKPAWYHKEMAILTQQLNRIDAPDGTPGGSKTGDEESGAIEDEPEDFIMGAMMSGGGGKEKPQAIGRKHGGRGGSSVHSKDASLTKAQDLAFKKKFGMTPEEALKTSPVGSAAPSFPSSHREGPRSASRSVGSAPSKARPRPQSFAGASLHGERSAAGSVGGGSLRAERGEYRPEDERSFDASQSFDASSAHSPQAPHQATGIPPRNNLMPFYTEPANKRPSRAGGARPASTSGARNISEFTEGDLMHELLERQKQKQQPGWRPRSAPRSRPREAPEKLERDWDAPTSRFGGFNQGAHAKSTIATKLNQAKKMADLYAEQEKRRKGRNGGRSRSAPRVRGGQLESDYWQPPAVMHTKVFSVV